MLKTPSATLTQCYRNRFRSPSAGSGMARAREAMENSGLSRAGRVRPRKNKLKVCVWPIQGPATGTQWLEERMLGEEGVLHMPGGQGRGGARFWRRGLARGWQRGTPRWQVCTPLLPARSFCLLFKLGQSGCLAKSDNGTYHQSEAPRST